MDLHPAVAGLAFLLGAWRGDGRGEYPTITPFSYGEEVEFTHTGKPFVAYRQRTWALDDERPLHAEVGFLRGAGDGTVELVLAHPTGIAEVAAGTVHGQSITVTTTAVARTPSAKDVVTVERHIDVDGDVLRYTVAMAAVGQPLTHHLAAELHRR